MTGPSPDRPAASARRLAIIGGGSSGLISLKHAREFLPDWEVVCFEKSNSITGCWGNPYPGFVSTSTKYTTQFSCYATFDANVQPDGGASRAEFFRDDEYGRYLEDFSDHFNLRPHIRLEHTVENLRRTDGQDIRERTLIVFRGAASTKRTERVDRVILCTCLAAQPTPLDTSVRTISHGELSSPQGLGHITGQQIVVVGGGESAVDYANRLARAELGNDVYLSLHSGVRVSPRYHPIRGVPSDFLRNRLMLSIHPDLRNWIGEGFVRARIRYQKLFERVFPKTRNEAELSKTDNYDDARQQRYSKWAFKLTEAAKDDLFNMFHNKSDDFLRAVAEERIKIVGTPMDPSFTTYGGFDQREAEVQISPDLVVPAIGYRSTLGDLSDGCVQLADFYLGCCHVDFPDLFLVGFARPIIGNIPSISEMQARLACGVIAGEFDLPAEMMQLHHANREFLQARFGKLNLDAVYPVEMNPYCDHLARLMRTYSSVRNVGSLRAWWRMQLQPATTLHYLYNGSPDAEPAKGAPIYMPPLLIGLLLMLQPVDWSYRVFRRFASRS